MRQALSRDRFQSTGETTHRVRIQLAMGDEN
jgi:hypothetical protein